MSSKPRHEHTCLCCGKIFTTVNKVAKTCSMKCRNKINYRRTKKAPEHRNCPRCNQTFEVGGKNWGQKYCSSRCSRKSHSDKENQDLIHILKKRIRSRLNDFVTGQNINVTGCLRYLGCDMTCLIAHLESKFQEGMSWENYGRDGWHLDHIIPLSAFDLTDPEQLKIACHYTNIQSLWAKDNLVKSNKIPDNMEELCQLIQKG